jgi:diguanylate cyclase (GGDEF)-like protein
MHILVVDKEPAQRLIICRLLKRAGFAVESAPDAYAGMTALNSNPEIALVLAEPVEFCTMVRHQIQDRYVYIVLLTARDTIESLVHGLQSGADDYLTKPVIEPELIARLATGKRIISLERRLRAMAHHDGLTGVFNRRYLTEQLPREIACSTHAPLSLVMCDVDHFKRVNDTHGHLGGDQVLIAVARVLCNEAETVKGWVARYGGEEFAIVLPGASLSVAAQFAEVVRASLSAHRITVDRTVLKITASFGVSGSADAVSISADGLLDRADRGVYLSKRQGRDRVTVIEQ